MNKHMYIGLVVGLIISVIINKIYNFENESLVTIACVVLGTFGGAALDNAVKKIQEDDD